MRFVFGMHFDGGSCPHELTERDAVAGERWGGSLSLLTSLEAQLGLSALAVTTSLRAVSLMRSLDMSGAFWEESARVDPFATADRLIEWDDELRLHGWQGEAISPRLEQLAKVMVDAPPGIGQRYARVLEELAGRSIDIEFVEILGTKRSELPKLYRRVFDALQEAGCVVSEHDADPVAQLGDLKDCLEGKFNPSGTGELQLIRPRGPLAAAEAIAVWMASLEDLSQTVIIGGDEVLDAALHGHGLPVLGASSGSGTDPLLQVLSLVIMLGWCPQDPAIALELLSLPDPPVPRGMARRLERALRAWPAVGSDAWHKGLRDGLAQINDQAYQDRLAERLDALFIGDVDGPDYPVNKLEERINALMKWLQGRVATDDVNVDRYTAAIGQVSVFRQLIDATGAPALSRPLVGRLLRCALDQVSGPTARAAEAGIAGVLDPGAIVGPVRRVVWWNFTERAAPLVQQLPLSQHEREALLSLDIAFPESGDQAQRTSAEWCRPLQWASEVVVLVCPRFGVDGEAESIHPLWDEVVAGLDTAQEARLISDLPKGVAAGRSAPELRPPMPRREWQLARPDTFEEPRQLSPTSINLLIANPIYWVLNYMGRLSTGRADGLPSDSLMIGRLAHEIIGRLLQRRCDGEKLTPDTAASEADRLFTAEGPRLYAQIFAAGRERQRGEIRRRTVDAARDLMRHLDEAAAKVVAVEQDRTNEVDGLDLSGRPDLVVAGPDVVLDIKWGGAKMRRQELVDGAASQLTVYTRLVNPGASIGYYIARDQTLLVCGRGFPGAEKIDGPLPAETWSGVCASLADRFDQFRRGMVIDTCAEVDGHTPPERGGLEDGKLVLAPQPQYSEFAWVSYAG